MILNIVLIVLGIIVVLYGADRLTEGAVALATRLGISQMVIGLTVVSIGTSMPELSVSLVSALNGTSDLAVGNVVGSNIFNSLMIVGCAAVVMPVTIPVKTVKRDIPFALIVSCLLLIMGLNGVLSRIEAIVLLVLMVLFMVVTVKGGQQEHAKETPIHTLSVAKSVFFLLLGLVGLIVGSQVFVNNSVAIAHSLGVSEAVIGLTIVAGGTSLPELATSVVAAKKGESGIAIGNALGSNIFNILLILGVTGIIQPLTVHGISWIDYSMLVVSMLLLWLFSFTKYTIARWEGVVLLAVFAAYLGYLVFTVI